MTGTPEQIAWAAGLFEGEGCISVQRGTPRKRYGGTCRSILLLSMNMTDRDVVERFRITVDEGHVRMWNPPYIRDNGYQVQWRWQLAGRRAKTVVWLLLPWLGERRKARFVEVMAQVWNSDDNYEA